MSSDIVRQVYAVPAELEMLCQTALEQQETEGELDPVLLEEIERAAGDKEKLISALGCWYLYTASKLAGLEAEYAPIIEAMRLNTNSLIGRMKFIQGLVEKVFPPSLQVGHTNDSVDIFYQQSSSIQVDDPDKLPFDMGKMVCVPDKAAIGKAIQSGRGVPGASLQKRLNLQIKVGGPKALAAAKNRMKKRLKADEEKFGLVNGERPDVPGQQPLLPDPQEEGLLEAFDRTLQQTIAEANEQQR